MAESQPAASENDHIRARPRAHQHDRRQPMPRPADGRCDIIAPVSTEAPTRVGSAHRIGYLLFVVAAIDLATYSAIVPLLPGYADRFDASDLEAGILVGAFSAAVVVFSI